MEIESLVKVLYFMKTVNMLVFKPQFLLDFYSFPFRYLPRYQALLGENSRSRASDADTTKQSLVARKK
jgi:hypothetical protein